MRNPASWLLAVLFVAGCGNSQKDTQAEGSGALSETPGATESPSTSTTPVGGGGPIKAGSKVAFHFAMKVDGNVVQDSHQGQPMHYVQGSGQVFPALETSLESLKPGDKKSVTLKAEDAFGTHDSTAVQVVPRASIPNADSLQVGQALSGSNAGQRFNATVTKITKDDITLDLNHPFAGKPITFDVEIVSVE
jgi:peptidylprolyl isomerase